MLLCLGFDIEERHRSMAQELRPSERRTRILLDLVCLAADAACVDRVSCAAFSGELLHRA